MKKALALAIAMLICFYSQAQKIPSKPSPAKFVNDYAGMLSAGERRQIEDKLREFDRKTSTQIVVVVINSLQEHDAGDMGSLANAWARQWQIGQKGSNNGLLLMISKQDRKSRIEVGYGLEGAIPDLKAADLLDQVLKPNFKAQQYYKGIDEVTTQLISLSQNEFKPEEAKPQQIKAKEKGSTASIFIVLAVIGAVVGATIFFIGRSRASARKKRFKQVGIWLDDDAFWAELAEWYMPEQVGVQRKQMQEEFVLLTDTHRKEVSKLHDMLVDMKHQGHRYFKERNDGKIRKALKKIEGYQQDPIYDRQSCEEAKAKLQQELAYFQPKSLGALSEQDGNRLVSTNHFCDEVMFKPEQTIRLDARYICSRIESILYNERFWDDLEDDYTRSSIGHTRANMTDRYERLRRGNFDTIAEGIALFKFYEEEVLLLKNSPYRFLDEKPQPAQTTVVVSNTSWGGGGGWSSSSDSSGSSDWGSSSSSDFGGGDFGGGGASGDW